MGRRIPAYFVANDVYCIMLGFICDLWVVQSPEDLLVLSNGMNTFQ
mgnify:CR=1 FL=1